MIPGRKTKKDCKGCNKPFVSHGKFNVYCNECNRRLKRQSGTRTIPSSNRDEGKGVYSKT